MVLLLLQQPSDDEEPNLLRGDASDTERVRGRKNCQERPFPSSMMVVVLGWQLFDDDVTD